MPETATLTLAVELGSGQRWAVPPRNLDVEAVDIVTAKVAKSTTSKVAVQPGASEKVKFLLITSSVYPKEKLSFQTSADNGDAAGDSFVLDQPQLILGQGMIKMLGGSLNFLHVKNETTEDALITIVVGRDSIVPPSP